MGRRPAPPNIPSKADLVRLDKEFTYYPHVVSRVVSDSWRKLLPGLKVAVLSAKRKIGGPSLRTQRKKLLDCYKLLRDLSTHLRKTSWGMPHLGDCATWEDPDSDCTCGALGAGSVTERLNMVVSRLNNDRRKKVTK